MYLKIMKVVMNGEGHRTTLFSVDEKRRWGREISMLNPWAILCLLRVRRAMAT
jgi:hypothetical protein